MKAIPAYIAIFLILSSMLLILVFSQTEIMKERVITIQEAYNIKSKQLSTEIDILKIEHIDNLIITIINSGSEKLNPNRINVYMPLLINSTTNIIEEFNLINPLIFDPGERAEIIIDLEKEFDINQSLSIITENSFRKNINFILKNEDLEIKSASSSNNEDIKSLLQQNNNEAVIEIETDSDAYLWINFSSEGTIQESVITINHYFSNTNDITAHLQYKDRGSWTTISELSYFEDINTDVIPFNGNNLNFRIRYYSNNAETIYSYVDLINLNSNIIIWWD